MHAFSVASARVRVGLLAVVQWLVAVVAPSVCSDRIVVVSSNYRCDTKSLMHRGDEAGSVVDRFDSAENDDDDDDDDDGGGGQGNDSASNRLSSNCARSLSRPKCHASRTTLPSHLLILMGSLLDPRHLAISQSRVSLVACHRT